MTIQSMNLSWIVVNDIQKAVDYYKNVVGLQVEEFLPEMGWAELSAKEGSYRLGLAQVSEEWPMKAGSNAVMTLKVKDIQKSRKELADRGVQLVGEVVEVPGHVKMQLFLDPDGNQMQLVEESTG